MEGEESRRGDTEGPGQGSEMHKALALHPDVRNFIQNEKTVSRATPRPHDGRFSLSTRSQAKITKPAHDRT